MTRRGAEPDNDFGDRTEVVPYEQAVRRPVASSPKQLGRYRLEKILAQGGMAEIWLATVDGPGRFQKKVVVKRIRPSLVRQAQASASEAGKHVEMFVREAKLLATLDHKNIVQVFEFGVEPPTKPGEPAEHYIVMELLEGLTLRDLALRCWHAGRPLPVELVVRSVADACLGLDHAHRLVDQRGQPANLVHRDISPDNLFVTTAGMTKLLDFGIAKREDWAGLTTAGELKGKVPYMAPEQLKGERVDARTDIFAVGVVLYWLLSGRRPFDGPSDVFTMKAILDDPPRPLRALNPEVPPLLENVVLSCLDKDPERRIGSAAALHDALSMLLLGLTGPAPDMRELVLAAQGLPAPSYETTPDCAAVRSQGWPEDPLLPRPTGSLVPDPRDVSQASTMRMALDGARVVPLSVPPARRPPERLLGQDEPATFHEIDPADIPSTIPPQAAIDASADAPTNQRESFVSAGPSTSARSVVDAPTLLRPAPLASDEAPTLLRPKPVSGDTPTAQRGSSWKDQVPAVLQDTVDLGIDAADPRDPPPSSAPAVAPSGPLPPSRTPATAGAKLVSLLAGVLVAVGALGGLAYAFGFLDADPVATNAIDAGTAPASTTGTGVAVIQVVDAGVVASVDAGTIAAVDAGAVAAIVAVDAGAVAAVAAGPGAADAGVGAVDDDAGVVADAEDDEELPDTPHRAPKKKKKRGVPVAAGQGFLVVRARPWARVIVDGVALGNTPLPALPLPAGTHQVRLEHDGVGKAQAILIEPGKTSTLQVDMRR